MLEQDLSGLTAASRIAQAIDRLTMNVPSRTRIDSLISAAVATMRQRRSLRLAAGRDQVFAQALQAAFLDLPQYRGLAGLATRGDPGIEPRRDRVAPRPRTWAAIWPASPRRHRGRRLALGLVAEQGLVKLFPAVSRCTCRRTAGALLRRDLASRSDRSISSTWSSGARLSASAWRSNAAWIATAIPIARKPRPSQIQNSFKTMSKHDENRQRRRGREPFRKACSRDQLANPEEQADVFRLIPTSTKSARAVQNPSVANTPAPTAVRPTNRVAPAPKHAARIAGKSQDRSRADGEALNVLTHSLEQAGLLLARGSNDPVLATPRKPSSASITSPRLAYRSSGLFASILRMIADSDPGTAFDHLIGRSDRLCLVLVQDLERPMRPSKGGRPVSQEVERAAQRIDVGPGVDTGRVLRLLGRHVARGSDESRRPMSSGSRRQPGRRRPRSRAGPCPRGSASSASASSGVFTSPRSATFTSPCRSTSRFSGLMSR